MRNPWLHMGARPNKSTSQLVLLRYLSILPYKLKTTNEQLTYRAGLVNISQAMKNLELSKNIENCFPIPISKRRISSPFISFGFGQFTKLPVYSLYSSGCNNFRQKKTTYSRVDGF